MKTQSAKLPRTRFSQEIVAEYYRPRRPSKKVLIFCDGMPSIPSHQQIIEFYGRQGYWVFYPRYRGSWESGGKFLRKSPHQDILDIVNQLPKGFSDARTKIKFKVRPSRIFLMGGSFAGPAIILASADRRVDKAIVRAPVVDWLSPSKAEPLNWFGKYVREAFGEAYRFTPSDWKKLSSGKFYNPAAVTKTIDGSKLLLIHAKDDPVVAYESVRKFATDTGAKLVTLPSGGHMSSKILMKPRFEKMVKQFFTK